MKDFIVKKNAYLYMAWCGELKIYKGNVRKGNFCEAVFETADRKDNIACSPEPGVVYAGAVWFNEKNDNMAKAAIIQYEEAEIAILKEQIEVKTNKINKLKGKIKS